MEKILFINFKTYEQSTGKNALQLAKIAEAISKKNKKKIVLVVQSVDLKEVAKSVSLDVFAQHVDPVVYGANTGGQLPEALKQAGAKGTILNHAEKKVDDIFLQKAIIRAKEAGLKVMCCAETTERAKKIASFAVTPDLIAVEPPELIGGNISVSEANPRIIEETVKEIHKIANIPVVAGAGITSTKDVLKSVELGCIGVFVASSIVKAKDQAKAIEELLSGF
ncbi:MAG: triose-phosphate isomerase [Candidatus Diapherotrites archaeon CG08_land_8_20_14_0_20_34_12]|nr:MAG: triose-phosphate isomerase [Candidatus Diapherotrites archaeon CG08_land_8_20_14_0_20_34_12]